MSVAVAIVMPKLGLTMETGTVVSWRAKEGSHVEKGEAVLEVETDKIVTEVQSPASGTLLKILVPEGTEARVQAVLAVVGEPGEDSGKITAKAAPGSGTAAADRQRTTPRARKLMAEHGLSTDDLEGFGGGRITEADILKLLQRRNQGVEAAGGAAGQVQAMSGIEKVVAARMTESFRDVPQFSLRFTVVMDHVLSLLPRLGQSTAAARRITVNGLILRAAAIALSRSPDVQYQYRPNAIFKPNEINLGFAVALGRDLVVPVIRRADGKRIAEICDEAADLISRARSRSLEAGEVSGGTFTVSNLGMFGIASFVPIVNPGEGAILGVGAVRNVVLVRDGEVSVGRSMDLTLVCDHRAVNGAIGAEFCRQLTTILETEETAW